jgi:hypothetical protein
LESLSDWLEFVRDEWEGISIHADSESNNVLNSQQSGGQQEPATTTVQTTRQITGGEEGEQLVE